VTESVSVPGRGTRRFRGLTSPLFIDCQGFFSGIKPWGNESDHSSPSKAEVKNEWSYTSFPPICLRAVDKDNFKFAQICDLFTFKFRKITW